MAAVGGVAYERRRPEKTLLYKLVQEHLLTFLATMEVAERALPTYVVREFERYLACGDLARGFARVECSGCGYTRLVAFACKSRSFCPSCLGRTMNETAAYLVDHVIGDVPVRHWVLSLPPPLRYLVAHDAALCSAVLGAFVRSVTGFLRGQAKRELGLDAAALAQPGAVTVIQRASSHLALNPHFHSIVTDGVYVREPADGKLTFRALPAPSKADVANVAWQTCQRVCKLLRKRGLWLDADPSEDPLAQREPGLAACAAASVQGVLLLGPRAGQRLMRLFGEAAHGERDVEASPEVQVPGYGFSVHAQTRISAHDRQGRERLCRYLTRPPLAQDRLHLLASGHVRLGLKRPWSDGTTSVVFEPLDFLSKLAALVPPPRMHRTRYHGVWSSHAKARREVTSQCPAGAGTCPCGQGGTALKSADEQAASHERKSKRYDWARLLARVFDVDVLSCTRCGAGRMQRVAFVTKPAIIRAMLSSVGLAADSPVPAPSRLGHQTDLFDVA